MSFSHFSPEQITPLVFSLLLLLVSIVLQQKKQNVSLIFLFAGTLVLGYFMANLDHFLILWDEQYHALVAKNLSTNPLKPTLYAEPLLKYDHRHWTGNHIWLHKQPLFLWQIALSIKIFGATELAVRIPSIVMHAIIPLFIYRVGKIALNRNVGYYGALFFAVAYFPLELVAGRYSTDHNDIAFLFYVTASFWAWFEYQQSHQKYWLILLGLFSGGAVLVKWLMGLLVYVIWIITKTFTDKENLFRVKSYIPMVYSGMISLLVFIPWQIYTSLKYPLESSYERQLNGKHFFNAVEDHTGTFWFHFSDGLRKLYGSGDLIPFLLLLGAIILIVKIPNKTYKFFIGVSIVFVYLFFSIAATKMIAFALIVSPFIYLGLGYLIDLSTTYISDRLKLKHIGTTLNILIVAVIAFQFLNLNKIQNYHTNWKPHDNHNRIGEEKEMKFINSIDSTIGDTDYVIFNASITVNGEIPIMFYTDYIAYNFVPSKEQIKKIRDLNKKVAILDLGNLPQYIHNDKGIKILELNP